MRSSSKRTAGRDTNCRTISELKNDCDFLLNSIETPLVEYKNVAEMDLDGFIQVLDEPIIDEKLTNVTIMTLYTSKTDNEQDKRSFLATDAKRLKNVKIRSRNEKEMVDVETQVCREGVPIAIQTEPESRVDCDVQTVVNQAATSRLKKTVFGHRLKKRHKEVKEKTVERREDSTQMYEHVTSSDLLCVEWINKSLFHVAMNQTNLIVDDKLRNASETTIVSSNSCNEDFLLSDK